MNSTPRQTTDSDREQLIESHLPLVRAIARRYAGRGENMDDLIQVGSIGLIRASDRFDPARGVAFATFATPAIEGEIRRHLGDRIPPLRIPRELQRMSGAVQVRRRELEALLGRSPTVDELASALGVKQDDVERALAVERARQSAPESADAIESAAGSEQLASAEDRLLLEAGARALDERERRIVFLRFHADMTEREIATEVGISQAQVSRVLSGALVKLRAELAEQGLRPAGGEGGEKPAVLDRGASIRSSRSGLESRKAHPHPNAGTRIAGVGEAQQTEDVALPYHVTVKAGAGDQQLRWTAALEELPGCEARGATPEEAVDHLRAAMENWFSAALKGRQQVQLPQEEAPRAKSGPRHSGRFLVRMPSALHEQLSRAAQREQLSLNRFVTNVLARSVAQASSPSLVEHPGDEVVAPHPPALQTRRSFRMLLAANALVIIAAAAAGVVLLVLALERGI